MNLGKLQQLHAQSRVEVAGKRRLCLNQEAGLQGFRRRRICDYGGRVGPSYSGPAFLAAVGVRLRPSLISVEPAGQACAVAAAGEDGGGRRGGA